MDDCTHRLRRNNALIQMPVSKINRRSEEVRK
jgi:hypothetical protein